MKKIGAIISRWWTAIREDFRVGVREGKNLPKNYENSIAFNVAEGVLTAVIVGLPTTIAALFAFDWIKGKDNGVYKKDAAAPTLQSIKPEVEQAAKPMKSWEHAEKNRRIESAGKETSLSA